MTPTVWFLAMRGREGFGVRALEFAALTNTRIGKVRGASWAEIDQERALWIIPCKRMKMGKEHRIPLSAAAMTLLKAVPRLDGSELVFPSSKGGELSDMTLSATIGRLQQAGLEAGHSSFLGRANKRPPVTQGLCPKRLCQLS